MTSIHSLPPEVFPLIFSHLYGPYTDEEDRWALCSAALVCRLWRDDAQHALFERVELLEEEHVTRASVAHGPRPRVHHTCDQTTTPLPVRLSTLGLFLNASIEDAVLSWIVASATVPLPSFRAIHLTPSSVTQLPRLAPTILGSLRHLAVDYPHDSAWQQIPPLYKSLESLTFSGIGALSFAGMSHPTLRHMVVSFDIPLRTTHPVFSISDLTVSKFPNLRRIDLPETLAYELESADGRTFLAECKPLVVAYKDGFVLEGFVA